MFTGAVMPTLGRISTLPSTRGCITSAPSIVSHHCQARMYNTYQRRRYPRITDQEITIRWSGHSHECGHLQKALASPPWAIASSRRMYDRVYSATEEPQVAWGQRLHQSRCKSQDVEFRGSWCDIDIMDTTQSASCAVVVVVERWTAGKAGGLCR